MSTRGLYSGFGHTGWPHAQARSSGGLYGDVGLYRGGTSTGSTTPSNRTAYHQFPWTGRHTRFRQRHEHANTTSQLDAHVRFNGNDTRSGDSAANYYWQFARVGGATPACAERIANTDGFLVGRIYGANPDGINAFTSAWTLYYHDVEYAQVYKTRHGHRSRTGSGNTRNTWSWGHYVGNWPVRRIGQVYLTAGSSTDNSFWELLALP